MNIFTYTVKSDNREFKYKFKIFIYNNNRLCYNMKKKEVKIYERY